jgi:ubiquinone/menaquinone biosynthesis C-methylase UbiE
MRTTLRSLLNRFPRLKAVLKSLRNRFSRSAGVSSHYESLQADEALSESARLRDAWQSDTLPRRQRELVDAQLAAYRRGQSIDVFDVLSQALRSLPLDVQGMSVLEVGCSSGFYSEVLEIADLNVRYTGCDYSEAFIALARQTYPALRFDVEDATALDYANSSFDIVVSGCCLLHIPEYALAVEETARVACRYAIFHRTPVVWGQPEQWYRKQAYGVETVEIHFNECEFLALLKMSGLELIATYTLGETFQDGVGNANRSYVCRKITS